MTLSTFCSRWGNGTWPVWQEAAWCAGAGIPVMARNRPRLVKEARARLGLLPTATEAMIVYEELRQRGTLPQE